MDLPSLWKMIYTMGVGIVIMDRERNFIVSKAQCKSDAEIHT